MPVAVALQPPPAWPTLGSSSPGDKWQAMRALPVGSRLDGERFLVALNLHNNEGVLPHQILQLIQVTLADALHTSFAHKLPTHAAPGRSASHLSATIAWSSSRTQAVHLFCLQLMAMLPSGDIVLSIYESGSHDSSPEWLELLGHLLELMHASALIVMRGSERGASGSQRIPQLAKLRNLALTPLWDAKGELLGQGAGNGAGLGGAGTALWNAWHEQLATLLASSKCGPGLRSMALERGFSVCRWSRCWTECWHSLGEAGMLTIPRWTRSQPS